MNHLLFLSHAGVDTEAALALAARIEAAPTAQEHALKVWVDKRDLIAGKPWKKSLQDALSQSTAFAVYLGSRGVVNWVWDEVSVALDRAHAEPQYPLIPIFAAGAKATDLPGFLSQYQGVAESEAQDEFSKLLKAVLRLESRARIEAERNPFVGLRSYDSGKAHLFFGRNREVDQLLGLLQQETLVMVTGDSGSGKSSLVKAGLIPAFRGGRLVRTGREGPDDTIWHTVETRPGSDPFGRLADDLRTTGLRVGLSPQSASELAGMVRQTEACSKAVSRNVDRIRDALLSSAPANLTCPCKTLLVVDQFEELATSPDARDYVKALLHLADPHDDQIRVVLVMRRDYYYLCATFQELNERLEKDERRARYLLQRMSSDGLHQSMVEPLRLAGIEDRVCDGLADAVLKDVGEQAGELALLQMALWRTWSLRQEHGGNLLSAYGAIGRVEGALAQAAQGAFADLSDDDRVRAETLFIRLVQPGESGSAMRRIARMEEFDQATQALARKLADESHARLLTLGERTVEIAHEQLATQWLQYQQWIRNGPGDSRGDDLRVLHSLIQDSSNWSEAGAHDRAKHLARGHDLDIYCDLADRRTSWLSDSERSFVAASWQSDNEEQLRRRRTDRALRRLTVVSFVTALVAFALLGAGLYLWNLRNEARGATLGTVAQAMLAQPVTGETSLLIAALAATGWQLGRSSDAWNALQRVPIILDIGGAGGDSLEQITKMIPSPDLASFVVLNSDGTVSIWSVSGRTEAARLTHGSRIATVALSSDGKTVATAGDDGTARLWDMENGHELKRLPHAAPVLTVTFSSDGRLLATADTAGTGKLWDVADGRSLTTFSIEGRVASLVLSHASRLVGTATSEGTARIISVSDNREVARFEVGKDLAQLAFSPDDGFLTIVQRNGIAQIVDVHSGRELVRVPYNGPPLTDVALSPNGRFIATATVDSQLRITSVEDGREVQLPQLVQSLGITALAFSPNGRVFAVANSEQSGAGSTGVVRSWAFEWDDRELARVVSNGPIVALAFSANGKFLATATADGVARVIAVADGNPVASIPKVDVKGVSLSTDGTLLATAGGDRTSRVWSVKDSREVMRLTHESAISAIAINSNGNLLSSVSEDGTLQSVEVAGTGKVVRATTGGRVESSAFSPDGNLLVFVGSDGAHVMNVPEGTLSGQFTYADPDDDEDPVSTIAISPDGKFAAVGYQKGLMLLRRVQDSKEVARFEDLAGSAAVAFSRDGRLLATGANNGVVRIIESPDGRELARIQHGRGVTSVAFSDSGLLATADDLGTVRIWTTKLDAMLQRLCQSDGRNLSRGEWTRSGYLNDLSWRPVCANWATPR